MKLTEAAVGTEALEDEVESLVADCLKLHEGNISLKEKEGDLRRIAVIRRERTEIYDMEIKK